MAAQDAQKYSNKLAGKRILLIGGSSGIGYGAAEAAVEFGAEVTISSSNPSKVQAAVEKLVSTYPSAKDRVHGEVANLGNDDIESVLEALFEKVGRPLDHVVYTAADKLAVMPVEDITLEKIRKASHMRVAAPVLMAKIASRYLTKSYESSITLTTGSVSEKPIPNWSVINAFGTGLHGLTRGLALDLKPIRVNCVSPGAVNTDLWSNIPRDKYQQFLDTVAERTTVGRVPEPEDIAEAYIHCIRDYNMSGTVLATNGGALLV